MFREMRRKKQEIGREACIRLLKNERRGVLAVAGDGGYPYALPVNFYYDEAENTIYFHCAKEGHKLDAMKACDKVCFTVWDAGEQRDGDWSYYVNSVIAFGRASLVTDEKIAREKAEAFGRKYIPTKEELEHEMAHAFGRVQMVAIRIEHMSGKLVHEK